MGGGFEKAKLCAWKSLGNYLEIDERRSDNECVKSQSWAEWSVAELNASIDTLAARRQAFQSFSLGGKVELKKATQNQGKV